jgi:hypothetical protein
MANVYVQRTLVQLNLSGIVGDIREGKAAFGSDSQDSGAEVKFGA